MELMFTALGGLALFLLAMQMMTDGLKGFAGQQLRHLLGHWTRTPLRGLGAGLLITGIVQSSSAVTVATIGFVNAGLLNLGQALGVIFGANVGTTMTGWLVSLVGFGFRIEAFALPILAVGVAIKLMSSQHRIRSLGQSLTGFALFFLGLSLLKDALGGFTDGLGNGALLANDYPWLIFVGIGFIATVLTQSSSAALAVILTAAASQLLSLDDAAAAVIGANLGTTSTAALSVIRATANAKRLAVGHILFNGVTAVIAMMILPIMLWFVAVLADLLNLEANAAVSLALFHTLFNVLGAVMVLPFVPQMTRLLGRFFRSAEEDSAHPRHLDDTLTSTPDLAVAAANAEIHRLRELVYGVVRAALDREGLQPAQLEPKTEAINRLNLAIYDYIMRLRGESMSPPLVEELTRCVRRCRYLDEVTRLAPNIVELKIATMQLQNDRLTEDLERYIADIRQLVTDDSSQVDIFVPLETRYQALKSDILTMAVRQGLSIENSGQILDILSAVRRLTGQWVKSSPPLPEGEKHAHQHRRQE